jgi:hypothetical protein
VRAKHEPDPFDRFQPYVRQRLADDQHVWATALLGEVAALDDNRRYQAFTGKLRGRELEPCSSCDARAYVDIEHAPGAEIRWDWLELDDTLWGAKGLCGRRLSPLGSVPGLVLPVR